MTVLYFTATGNSLRVAKALGGKLHSIPKLLRNGKFNIKDDAIGIVIPIYSLNIPRIVIRYLSKAKLNAGYVFAVLTYGNMPGDASGALAKLLAKNGNRLDYAKDILMVDNYLPLFKIEKQLEKLPQKNVDGQIRELLADISARKLSLPKKNIFFKLLTLALNPAKSEKSGKTAGKADKAFSVDEKCNKCGICAKVCPTGNIKIDGKPKYLHHCESCYACIHNCPRNAVHVRGEKSAARFRNSEVTLNEIIQANS